MLRTQTILTEQLDAAESKSSELEELVSDLEEDDAAHRREIKGLQGKLKVADIKVEDAEESAELERDRYGLTPEQYHSGLDKLWDALGLRDVQDQDVFTLSARCIRELEEEHGGLERSYSNLMDKARDLKVDRDKYYGAINDWYNDEDSDICELCDIAVAGLTEIELCN